MHRDTRCIPPRRCSGSIEVLGGYRVRNRLGDETVPRMSRMNIADELIDDVRAEFNKVHDDPRYKAFLKKMNLPE
jgi:hypothetical protein